MSAVISVDFETFYSKKLKYGLKTMIAEQYVRHNLFDAYMISVSDGKTCWAGHPRDFTWSSLEGATLLSHNAYFDRTVYDELVRRKLAPQINYAAWHCTANLTSYLCNRRSLDEALQHLLGIKVSKAVRADAENKRWPEDFSPAEREAMLRYARDDAGYCWMLWDKFSPLWPEHERRLSEQTIAQGRRGVQINRDLLDSYILQTHEMKLNTEKLLPWLKDEESESWDEFDIKPTATKCIAEQCRRAGIPTPPIKSKEGEEAFEDWEKQYGSSNLWIPALSSWRSINRLLGTFTVMKSRLRDDGTMPFGQKYFAAHTGRSGGEAKINVFNLRKKPLFQNDQGLMETDEKKIDSAIKEKSEEGKYPTWVKADIDIRSLYVPRPGKQMIVSDLAQIEPRVLAWLAGDTATLELVKGGLNIYEAYAKTHFGFTGEKMDKKSMFYAEIKARTLALGYGAGWSKYIEMSATYTGTDITANDPEFVEDEHGKQISGYGQKARNDVAEWREKNPKIVALWKRMDDALRRSVGEDFVITLPSGRKMRYEKVRCERRIEPDEEGKPRQRVVFTAWVGGKRVVTYGGKIVENLTQGVARDVFVEGVLRIGDPVLFTCYDETINEVDKKVAPADIERMMSVAPDWMPELPVSAEAKIVPHYCK